MPQASVNAGLGANGASPPADASPEGARSAPFAPSRDLSGQDAATVNGAAPRVHETRAGSRPGVDADAALMEARAKIERHLGGQPKVDAAPLPGLKSIRDMEFRGLRSQAQSEASTRSLAGGLMARVAAATARAESSAASDAVAASNSASQLADAQPADNTQAAPAKTGDRPGTTASADAAEAKPAKEQGSDPAPAANGTSTQNAAAPPVDRARALEDAVAEMLRPMLREWLEANLPRLAQQVLREEMAKSPLPGKDNRGG